MEGIISQIFRLFVIVLLVSCVKASNSISQCGRLTTVEPTILGRNVTFSFIPDTYYPNAQLDWLRKNDGNPWCVLPSITKFTQYHQDGKYYLVLTDTVRSNDEVYYQVHYYNETIQCNMSTSKLRLKDISSKRCGFVYLRTTRIIEGETVELEYYPSKYVLDNPNNFERRWVRSTHRTITLNLTNGSLYEEKTEQNHKYVLKMFLSNSRMDGRYGVFCGGGRSYSDFATVKILVPPSSPTIVGLQNIDGCERCIVGESGNRVQVSCTTSVGTEPITVNMFVGNKLLIKPQRNGMAPSYIAFFTMRDGYHMENLTFTIMNDALVSPLRATAKVYVIKSPGSLLTTVPSILKEEESVNITCVSNSARPAPKLTVNISGTEVSPVQHTNYFNATTSLNTNIVSLTTFKRNWNHENIRCCRYSEWYRNKMECSTPKQVKYLFPPSKIKLTVDVKVEDGQPHEMQAICRIYESNPVCVAIFKLPIGIMGTEIHKKNIRQLHGAWMSEYTINLNASKVDNGKEIRCTAECTDFDVDLSDMALITFPYAPTIELNMSGPIVDVHKGEQEHVKCSAQSVPASNITWIEVLENDRNVTKKLCPLTTDCVMKIETQRVLKRNFICQAQYLKTLDQQVLTVNIIEKNEERLSEKKSGLAGKSIIWITVGACLVVLTILLVTFLVVRKKRRNTKAKRKSDSSNVDAVRSCRSKDEEQEEPINKNWNQIGVQAGVNPEALYSQPDKTKAATCTDATYSVVCKRSKAPTSLPQEAKLVKDGQLLYADLDFDDSNSAPSKGAIAQRPNTPTEYVAIDFVKTAAEQARGNQTDVAENVYANE